LFISILVTYQAGKTFPDARSCEGNKYKHSRGFNVRGLQFAPETLFKKPTAQITFYPLWPNFPHLLPFDFLD